MNKEVRHLIIFEIIISLAIILISFFSCNFLYNSYNNKVIQNYSYIISNVKELYPSLDSEVVSIINKKDNYEVGFQLLEKYGLTDSNYLDDLQSETFKIVLIILIPTIFLLIVINYILIKKIYKRITKIDNYMNNILDGDYSLDIKEFCEGDISNLKNDIYKMTIILKEQSELLIKEKKYLEELLEDISHQIKTPLTSMYMINDILKDSKDEVIREEFLEKNEKQIERIEWLIKSLLKMSRLDSGTIKLKREKTTIKNLIDQALEPITLLTNEINIIKNIENIEVIVDINWTSEAILNIIKNACEHTKNEITITAKSNPIYNEIIIKDNGTGIDKKDLPHIFERFYKGNHNKDSIGIGLNMSKKIITMQNGLIEVTNDEGAIFTIKLYKNK